MAKIIPFLPANDVPFQATITLDGHAYIFYVRWNIFGQRWYVVLYDTTGDLIFNLPLVESPLNYNISMTWGYFDTMLVFRESSQCFEVI